MEQKLNNLKVLETIDPAGMLKLQVDFYKQCEKAKQIAEKFEVSSDYKGVKKVVVTGMGGSAVGGDLLMVYLRKSLRLPFKVNRDYDLPAFVDEETLVITASYSGNTEETLSAYNEALKAKAKVIGITTGGKMKELCDENKTPCLIIPSGLPPRASLGYMFFPMLVILTKIGIIDNQDDAIAETINLLKDLSIEMCPECETSKNHAKQLALWLYKNMPVIYGSSEQTGLVALRWRNQFNENSKTFAISNILPELNHNELVGWETLVDITKSFHVMILGDKDDHPRVKKRIEITKDIIRERVGAIEEINSRGNSLLARLFSLISLGDFVSTYLAILYDVDPTPVKVIDYLKTELAKD